MSNRTALADKAIRDAWKREKELVREGKGTRDWTLEQQKDILTSGKAYDENGKAFVGHHMVSVEKNPEFQGEADNIQFLSYEEHKKAHNGDFSHNLTCGYYDPVKDETIEFTDGKYIPCKVIELSNPLPQEENDLRKPDNKQEESSSTKEETITASSHNPNILHEIDNGAMTNPPSNNEVREIDNTPNMQNDGLWRKFKRFCKRSSIKIQIGWWQVKQFAEENPEIVSSVIDASVKLGEAIGENKRIKKERVYESETIRREECSVGESSKQENSLLVDCPGETIAHEVNQNQRSSPKEHIVSAGGQHYWKNGERVWIEKDAYPRGGNKETAQDEEI